MQLSIYGNSSSEECCNGCAHPNSLPIISLQKIFVKQFSEHFAEFLWFFRKNFPQKDVLNQNALFIILRNRVCSPAAVAFAAFARAFFDGFAHGGIDCAGVTALRSLPADGAEDLLLVIFDEFFKFFSALRAVIL